MRGFHIKLNRLWGKKEEMLTRTVGEKASAEAALYTRSQASGGIRPGRRVRHHIFGSGKVVTISHDGTRARAVIEFDRAGRKTLILQFARLEPL